MAEKTKQVQPLQQVYATMAYELIAETILDDTHVATNIAPSGEFTLPPVERVIVSYGWLDGKGTRGVCIHGPETVKDKDAVIFVRPDDWVDARTMLTVLTHEMVHAGLWNDDEQQREDSRNHVGDFEVIADYLGLKNGGTEPNDDFLDTMDRLAEQLPEFPAAALEGLEPSPTQQIIVRAPNSPNAPPEPVKQKNRNRRYVCDCGVIIRAFRDDLQAVCELCGTRFQHRAAKSE